MRYDVGEIRVYSIDEIKWVQHKASLKGAKAGALTGASLGFLAGVSYEAYAASYDNGTDGLFLQKRLVIPAGAIVGAAIGGLIGMPFDKRIKIEINGDLEVWQTRRCELPPWYE